MKKDNKLTKKEEKLLKKIELKEKKEMERQNKLHNFFKVFRRLLIFIILILIFILTFYFTTDIQKFLSTAKDQINNKYTATPTTIYEIRNNNIKRNVALKDLSDNFINAYIAIEDQRFYTHNGVDLKRTAGAIASFVINQGNAKYGGSTITQQLVKNLTGNNEDTTSRKIKEWVYAIALEKNYSKERILEAYFNIIYVGPGIYGVKNGANFYFNKEVTDLTLVECAFMAGLNNSPNSYNPFAEKNNEELIKTRTKTVLYKMNELGYISNNEYNVAVEEVDKGITFTQGK